MLITVLSRIKFRVFIFSILIFVHETAFSQANLNTQNLNASIKEIQRTTIELRNASAEQQAEYYYLIGTKADDLAMQLTRNVMEYGDTTKGLVELIVKRAQELDVNIQWYPEKNRFFYDGKGFIQYLQRNPDGSKAAECTYQLLESDFFKSSGDDIDSLLNAIKQKKNFLETFSRSDRTAEVRIMLAIEYRDIARLYLLDDTGGAVENYINQAMDEIRYILDSHPATRESRTAETLQESILEEFEEYIDNEV